jgi:hypothetical protein
LIFDRGYDPAGAPHANPHQPRRISTDLVNHNILGHTLIDLINHGVHGPANRRIRIDPTEIYIYAGVNSMEDLNRAAGVNLAHAPRTTAAFQ